MILHQKAEEAVIIASTKRVSIEIFLKENPHLSKGQENFPVVHETIHFRLRERARIKHPKILELARTEVAKASNWTIF